MKKTCTHCSAGFEITPDDLVFYDKVSPEFGGKKYAIPPPTMCPSCRRQQRLMFRNFFRLYHRECDLTGKKIISMYDKDVPFPVYEMHEWWDDAWDAESYSSEVHPSESFLLQVERLHRTVPRMSIVNSQCENTDYCNFSLASRNCYLVFGSVSNEDCSYGHIVWQSHDCFDCLYCYRCEFCYECIDCVQCHTINFSRDCDGCSDSMFLVHCNGCRSCFGCVGLKNKEYHIFNEAHTKEEYEQKIADLNIGSRETVEMAKLRVRELTGSEIVKTYHGFGCENVVGDYLYNCKNIVEGFDLKNCEDCSYSATLESFADSQDCNFSPAKSELCYNSITVHGHTLLCCHSCLNGSSNLSYCDNCYACQDCFGCAGLKNKRYCILNKQYTKEEYVKIVTQLTERMKVSGEWGEFFPHSFSPFAYNETIACEYFPLNEKEVGGRGWQWKMPTEENHKYMGPVAEIPNDIQKVDDDICEKILRCSTTNRLYKITSQELAFYRQMNLPVPTKCFDQRHKERMALRNPRKLWGRQCAKCSKEIQTTYAPERPEIVYCESCYLQTVY